jgi:hypothetical protein
MSEFSRVSGGVRVDLSQWGWLIGLYLDDLEAVLGPKVEVPDDPLEALAASIDATPSKPSDPVRARLLPDGVLDDEQAAAEFRRFSEASLLQRKHADASALRAAAAAGVSVVDEEGARRLLGALNDVRLMLGTRLGVTEHGVLAGGEDLHAYATYQLLTALQSLLVDVLAGAQPDAPHDPLAP